MKTLARNIPITLHSQPYVVDILLGMYATSKRPAVILPSSRPSDRPGERAWEGSPVAIASTCAPEEYIQHLTAPHFPAKNWAENEGLWEQLLPLLDAEGSQLFLPTRHAITLGYCRSQIILLGSSAQDLFAELLDESLSPSKESRHG